MPLDNIDEPTNQDKPSGIDNSDNPTPSVEDPLQTFVKETITKEKVVIFSKTTCPFCVKAKRYFREINQPYKAIELNKRDDGRLIQEILGQMTGASTVPRVFIKGKSIGGSLEVNILYNNGRLGKLLRD